MTKNVWMTFDTIDNYSHFSFVLFRNLIQANRNFAV